MTQAFSLRKIPFIQENSADINNPENTDNVKILELSNTIDEWEREILFSENGFYTLTGKNVENKTKEFISNLETLINSKITKIVFTDINSRTQAVLLKNTKINAIKEQMELYEKKQLKEWELEVYESAISSAKERAVLYRYNSEIVSSSYNQAAKIIEIMANEEKWDNKTKESKIKIFESDFYLSLINEFIKDKNVQASVFYEKYKNKLNVVDREKIEYCIKELKNNVIAYNWAKELFSYNLSEKENEKEISLVKDKDIEPLIRHFFNEFKSERKKETESKKKEQNENNWKEIIEVLKTEPDKAILYIDFSLPKENQKNKKEYIKQIINKKYIKTDKEKFINLFKELYENYEEFKEKDISDLRTCFSEEDFKIIEELKKQTEEENIVFVSDYDYISKVLSDISDIKTEEIYNFIKYTISAINDYKKKNKGEIDIESRNKIIKSALERYNTK